jgi:UDP-N-acetylglucosamine 2-epimerase (non-hydrolysing)
MDVKSSITKVNLPVYFVIGTRAQFIKVAPVMRVMLDSGMSYILIYTAQHQENIQEILEIYKLPNPDVTMYRSKEANTRGLFLLWFINILYKALFQSKKYIRNPGIVLTHGDTSTAWLAALMGKRANCIIGHIESGCRSYNIFSPFPEEISRLITFQLSDIYFCADEWAVGNLKKYKGKKVNMGANTMLDGVRYALNYPSRTHFDFEDSPFVIVSIHRFENIFTTRLTDIILPILKNIANRHHLIFTLHPTMRERLRSLSLYEPLDNHPNITLHERFDFVDWINLCNKALFVITDGGSNQEELSYLGVPTLLFRCETERKEGLGENVVISRFDKEVIDGFYNNLDQYRKKPSLSHAKPSEKIVQIISEGFHERGDKNV